MTFTSEGSNNMMLLALRYALGQERRWEHETKECQRRIVRWWAWGPVCFNLINNTVSRIKRRGRASHVKKIQFQGWVCCFAAGGRPSRAARVATMARCRFLGASRSRAGFSTTQPMEGQVSPVPAATKLSLGP